MLGDGKDNGGHAARDMLLDDSTPSAWNRGRGDEVGRPGGDMDGLAQYWRLALKHRLLIAGIFIVALVIGAAFTMLTTPMYTATTTLQIDREAARVLNVEDTSPRESMVQGEEFFQTQFGLLRSRSLAEAVIESEGLASSDAFLEAMGASTGVGEGRPAGERAALRRERVLSLIRANLGVSPVRGSRLVSISFNSPDAALSARIANAFAESFIQSNLDRKYESSTYAREFLEDRITQTKATLEDAERQLVAYAAQQQIINVGGSADAPEESRSLTSSNLLAINTALAQATAKRVAAEEKWRQVSRSSLLSLPEVFENPAIQRLSEERARLSSQYQQNLSVYQPDYPQMVQLKSQMDEIDRQVAGLGSEIRNSVRAEYQIAVNEERSLLNRVRGLQSDVLDLRDRSIQYNILQREVDTSRTLYDALLQRYKEVSITGIVASNNVSVVDAASPPRDPSSPKLLINLAIAAFLGLGLGVLAAFVIEALDESLSTPDDVETKLGVPVLGAVPQLDKSETPANALANSRSAFSEAYYSLRTALQFSTADGAPRSLLVTSSRPAEGKSTTAFALAQSFARIGKRVLLVDGDLRNPSMHRLMGVDNEKGMSNVLSGSETVGSVAHVTAIENMSFISCGPLPPNPAELWAGDRVHLFLQDALSQFDHVVIDGPPVLGFADAPILAATVGGTLFILESRGTRRGQARGALRRIQMGSARLLGIVLTKFNARTTSYGGYDYSYDYNYGPESSAAKGRKR